MSTIRRINLFGGPGAGKSTTAAWLFAQLKDRQISVELVNEYVKSWAYQNRSVHKFDQTYLFAKQQHYEYRCLNNGVEVIITDSPTALSTIYALKYVNVETAKALQALNELYTQDFPCLNIFLERGDKPYVPHGRYQTHEEAKELDETIMRGLEAMNISYSKHPFEDREGLLRGVLGVLNHEE